MEKQKQMIYVWLHACPYSDFFSPLLLSRRAACDVHFATLHSQPFLSTEAARSIQSAHNSPSRITKQTPLHLFLNARYVPLCACFPCRVTLIKALIQVRWWQQQRHNIPVYIPPITAGESLWAALIGGLVVTPRVQWIYFHASSWKRVHGQD